MEFKDFLRSMNEDGIEGELIKTIFISLISSLIITSILYFAYLRNIDNFFSKYGFYLLFAILSYSLIVTSIRQIKVYKEFACMPGMMIGMTIGMISGFLSGFYIGATNGMFYGSLFGMLIGIYLGTKYGSCCGVTGFLEGIMAGFMGGLMGAMSSVMMLNDNLKAASIVVFLISAVILFGLSYMVYKETREAETKKKTNQSSTIVISIVLTLLTILMMVYGPRSLLFQ